MIDRTRTDIPSPETLFRILERERARTDRSGMPFSLVVVDTTTDGRADAGRLKPLADILSRRIRATDVVGMFSEGSLGVILPSTPAEGASKFIDNVRPHITNGDRAPLCLVYTYPSSWGPSGRPPGDPPPPPGKRGRRQGVPADGRDFRFPGFLSGNAPSTWSSLPWA